MNQTPNTNENMVIMLFNLVGVVAAYVMLGASLYLSTDVPLATKGYWGIAVLMLTISLVNFVKFRFDERASNDRINRLMEAQNEKMLEDFVGDK